MFDSVRSILKKNSLPMQPIPTGISPSYSKYNFSGIFFDVYGTLFISDSGDIGVSAEPGKSDLFIEALNRSGFSSTDETAGISARTFFFSLISKEHERAKKMGIEYPEVDILAIWASVLETLIGNGSIRGEVDRRIIKEVAARYESLSNRVYPMPGATEILTFFQKLGIPIGIVSNAQFYTPDLFPALLNSTLEDLGVEKSLCVWSYIEGEAKPSTALFHTALKRLAKDHPSINGEQLLYVGNDMLNDIKTAKDAGFKTVFFAGDKRSCRLRKSDSRVAGCKPDFIINDLQQLKNIWYSP